MQAYIIAGSTANQQNYITDFVSKNNIPSYLTTRFEDMKILDARNLQKSLALKLQEGEKRLIVIVSPTQEAQNALLKTVEELSSDTFVFFLSSSYEDLLSTIVSRCVFVALEKEQNIVSVGLETKVRAALQGTTSVFSLSEFFGPTLELHHIEVLLLALRKILLDETFSDSKETLKAFLVTKKLHSLYKLAKNNNVNKRMVLEHAFIS